jgi:hypothetical protein
MLRRNATGTEDIDARGDIARRIGGARAIARQLVNGFGITTMNHELVSGAKEIARHRQSHPPQANKADPHGYPPGVRVACTMTRRGPPPS